MDHLSEWAKKLVNLPDEERIQKLKMIPFIGYDNAKRILFKLEDIFSDPRSHRMRSLLLVGDTNSGKTALLNKFSQEHPSCVFPDKDGIIAPVVYVQAPAGPDVKEFCDSILRRLNAPYNLSNRIDHKKHLVMEMLKAIETKILIIDEIQHLLAGPATKRSYFLNLIKYISNELQISLVCAGVKEAFMVFQNEPQLSNRFESAVLPPWDITTSDYLPLLSTLEQIFPLKKASNLAYDDLLPLKIISLSEGSIGEIVSLLKLAAREAIITKEEKITSHILDNCDYMTPSKRKKALAYF